MRREGTHMSSIGRLVGMTPISVTVAVVIVLGPWTPERARAQTVEDSAAIRERTDAYLRAWDAHDASGLGTLFAEDADMVMGNQPTARGRRQIRESWRTYFEAQEPERHLRLDIRSLRFLPPDVAIMSVTTTTGGRDGAGGDLPARRFRGTWLWQRRGDGWLISAMRGLPLEEDRVVLNASLEATEALRPDIRGFVAAYEDALDAHDPGAVSAFYSDDAEIIVRNSPVASGRQAIESWWRVYFSEPRPYRALLIIDEMRTIGPDVALLNVTATGAPPERSPARPTPVRYARATWVLAREEAEWRIAQLLVLPSEHDRIVRSGGRTN